MDVISAFNRNAEEYDRWYLEAPGWLIIECEARALETLAFGGRGVEVGVGTGVFSSRLGVPLGLDPALEMIKIAKKRGVEVVRAVGEFVPLRDICMDYVLFAFTICFLKNLEASLKEAWRILKPGGSIILGFISRDSEWGELYSKKKAEGHRFYKHAEFYTVEEVEKALDGGGFKIVKQIATLSQGPGSVEAVEEASNCLSQRGFICVKAVKKRTIPDKTHLTIY